MTKIPAALLHEDGDDDPVTAGEVLSIGNRHIWVINPDVDAAGYITVEETYRIRPSAVGLRYRPEAVHLELNREETEAVSAFYRDALWSAAPVVRAGSGADAPGEMAPTSAPCPDRVLARATDVWFRRR